MSRLVLIGLSGLLMVTGSASAGIVLDDKSDFDGADFTVIDFETRGDGSLFGLEPGTSLKLPHDEYSANGITISVPSDGTGDERATIVNTSSPLSLAAISGAGSPTHFIFDRLFDGFVRVDFLVPVNAFGVSVTNIVGAAPLLLSVFDTDDNIIASAGLADGLIDGMVLGKDFGADEDVQFGFIGLHDPGATFAYALISEDIGTLDDIHFGVIPEPATLVLLFIGIGSCGLRRRTEQRHGGLLLLGMLLLPHYALAGTITGIVQSHPTPLGAPFLPDSVTNRPAQTAIPLKGAKVFLEEDPSVTTFSDENGAFTLEYAGAAFPVHVTARLEGQYDDVFSIATGFPKPNPESVLVNSVPASNITLTFNPPDPVTGFEDAEDTTAEVNAFVHMIKSRKFLQSFAPGIPLINRITSATVMESSSCANAGTTSSIQFAKIGFDPGGVPCRNGAYSTIIAHEYGHAVQVGMLQTGGALSFREGFADTFAIMVLEAPTIGQDFGILPNFNHSVTKEMYPEACTSGGVRDCGHVLSGVWWDIKENLQTTLGAINGLDTTRFIWATWAQITETTIDDRLAREILLADDVDGDLSNSTPHFEQICTAFKSHGSIVCPYDCRGDGKHNSQYIAEGALERSVV